MRQARIIIGSSYGDEGKGLAAAHAVKALGGRCLNVLINGGAQRGHTVDLPDGRRHVFHHFGSGAFDGAVSCADRDFILNPLLYADERRALADNFGVVPELTASARCRVTLPWDMMVGQIIEESRGAARHGSCGCGIYETILRFRDTDWAMDLGTLARAGWTDFRAACRRLVTEYLPARLGAMGAAPDAEWQAILNSEGLIERTWEDLRDMLREVRLYGDWADAARGFDHLVFEAGQGLALDAENRADFPHLTPSRTTSLISAQRVAALPGDTRTEVVYVTRSYLTRHGAGPFPTECPKTAINPDMADRTNVPNPHQQTLRYGHFDGAAVLGRVRADLAATRQVLPDIASAALVTHLNETGGALDGGMDLAAFAAAFDRVMVSDTPCDVRDYTP